MTDQILDAWRINDRVILRLIKEIDGSMRHMGLG
jgi:hypothetical protein